MPYRLILVAFFLYLSPISFAGEIIIIPGTGLNDTTNTDPVGGNSGTTLGQQRLNVFQKAADTLEAYLQIDFEVTVDAAFVTNLDCNSGSAILGTAGPKAFLINFANAPVADTYYPVALANNLVGSDTVANKADIEASFNAHLDNNANCLSGSDWYYGYDDPEASGDPQYIYDISFYSTVIHELLHGLGVLSPVDGNSGALFQNTPDAYTKHLFDSTLSLSWEDMTNSQRLASSKNTDNLVWSGSNVNTAAAEIGLTDGINNGKVEMHAPNPYKDGSSVSHFSIDASPNEIMEPEYTEFLIAPGLAQQVLQDIGWPIINGPIISEPPANSAPIFTSKDGLNTLYGNPLVHSLMATDANADTLTFNLTSYEIAHINASITGTELTLQGKNNFIGNTAITVTVSDGTIVTSQTINLTINEDFALASSEGNLINNSTLVIPNNAFEFTLTGGNRNYSVEVLFDGKNQTRHLLSTSGKKYYLAMPESGAFAGDYTITITDSNGETADFVIQRPLKLSANTRQLISNSTNQFLYIEGAPADTVLDLHINQGDQTLDLQVNNANVTQVIAPDDAANFNRAQVSLNVNDSTKLQTMNISADTATLPEGDITLTTLPFHDVKLTIKDPSGIALVANTQINDNRFIIWSLDQIQQTDELGKVTLSAPQEASVTLTVSAVDYQTKTIEVDPLRDQLNITLELLDDPATDPLETTKNTDNPTTDLTENNESVVKTSSSGGSGYLIIIGLALLISYRKRKQ